MAMLLVTLQGANWQRSGGKGDKPKQIKRPSERKSELSKADLEQRKRLMKQRRREAAQRGN